MLDKQHLNILLTTYLPGETKKKYYCAVSYRDKLKIQTVNEIF